MDFTDFCRQFCTRINDKLEEILPNESQSDLHQAMRYSTLDGGKRLRPLLVYATGLSFGGAAEKLDLPAAAVEIIHCYSLIHDDLPSMDNADLRRGKPSNHKQFNPALAILAGDALQALSFKLLATQPQMTSILSQACLKMAEGQALDIANQTNLTIEQLNHINQLKTGALIEASILLGAIAANCQQQNILTELKQYAQCIGLAFQINDDILDVTGQSEILGKPAHNDQNLNKITYPKIIGINKSQQKLQQLQQQAITHLKNTKLENSLLADLANYIVNRQK